MTSFLVLSIWNFVCNFLYKKCGNFQFKSFYYTKQDIFKFRAVKGTFGPERDLYISNSEESEETDV